MDGLPELMQTDTYNVCESFLAAVLRDETPPWPDGADADLMLRLGVRHGVNGLVEAAARRHQLDWPKSYLDGLADEARQQTGQEILRRRELVRVLDALAEQGITPLIMKGAALAYTHYESPSLRPRCDIDLLVREDDRDKANTALKSLGYSKGLAIPGRLVSYEQCYFRREAGFQHLVDLHWKINNRQVFARTFSYDDLMADAVAVAAIDAKALTLSTPHALLLACIHRVASLYSSGFNDGSEHLVHDRLIWLYDIRLLQQGLDTVAWDKVRDMAAAHRIAAIVDNSLRRSNLWFATAQPPVDFVIAAKRNELSAKLLEATRLQALLSDLECLSWWDRLVLLKELFLPPRDYILKRYGARRPLALQYVRRVIDSPRRKTAGGLPSGRERRRI